MVPRPADHRPRHPVRGCWLTGRAHNEGDRDRRGYRGRPLDDWVSCCAALGRMPPWNLDGKQGTQRSTRSFLWWHWPRTEAPPQGRRILYLGSLRRHLGGQVGCFMGVRARIMWSGMWFQPDLKWLVTSWGCPRPLSTAGGASKARAGHCERPP